MSNHVASSSTGSVVAYDLLRRDGAALGWRVPLYVTAGSPQASAATSATRWSCSGSTTP